MVKSRLQIFLCEMTYNSLCEGPFIKDIINQGGEGFCKKMILLRNLVFSKSDVEERRAQWREGLRNSNFNPTQIYLTTNCLYVLLLMKIQKNPENPGNI